MARKSRKENVQNISAEIKSEKTTFSCGIYGRLSLVNSGKKDDGDSIENQIRICENYLQEHPELKWRDTYIDNGKSGTSFDRPGFQRLMDDVKSGKINCIIVKDLSRFGRDYLEAGEYIEKIFPFLRVRFIAVTDGFDSFHSSVDEQTLTVPLKNVINEMYAKDLSQKICTSLHARMEKGEYLPGRQCYGYLRSDTENFKLIPDPVTAPIVKLMYDLRAKGWNYEEIRRHLDTVHAITPSQRKAQLERADSKFKVAEYWNSEAVKRCLNNPAYLGHMVYGKVIRALYTGLRGKKYMPKTDWKIVENTHEPLITQEQFDLVQELNRQSEQRYNNAHRKPAEYQNIYAGILKCGDCGKGMHHSFSRSSGKKRVKISVFRCGSYAVSDRRICSIHTIKENELSRIVMDQVKVQFLFLQSEQRELKRAMAESNRIDREIQTKLSELMRQRTRTKKLRESLYMNYSEGLLEEREFLDMKTHYQKEEEKLLGQIDHLKAKQKRLSICFENLENGIQIFGKYCGEPEPTREMVEALIDRINVFEDQSVEIIFRYSDPVREILRIMEETGNE